MLTGLNPNFPVYSPGGLPSNTLPKRLAPGVGRLPQALDNHCFNATALGTSSSWLAGPATFGPPW
jgi:hypothetical protein